MLRRGVAGTKGGAVLEDGKTLRECGLDTSMSVWEARAHARASATSAQCAGTARACAHAHLSGGWSQS